VLRTTRETLAVVVVAWLLGAAMCLVSLLYVQANIYAPAGLSLDLANLAPWLFTLPIPMAVVAASTGTVSRMLRRLDTVSVVEGRT
jgi:tellurite resistance protein TehA-like permease